MPKLNVTLDDLISAEWKSRHFELKNNSNKVKKYNKYKYNHAGRKIGIFKFIKKFKNGFNENVGKRYNFGFKKKTWKHDMFFKFPNILKKNSINTGRSKTTSFHGSRFTTSSGIQVTIGSEAEHIVRIIGLHDGVLSNDVKDIFDKYGNVNYAYVLHRDDGTHSGIGQACFAKVEDAKKATKGLQGASIDSIPIKVQYLGVKNNTNRNLSINQNLKRTEEKRPRRKYLAKKFQRNNTIKIPENPLNPLSR